jgi:hypothetical protein
MITQNKKINRNIKQYSTVKKEAAYFCETFINFYQTALRYIPEDGIVHSQRHENLKFH